MNVHNRGYSFLIPIGRTLTQLEEKNDVSIFSISHGKLIYCDRPKRKRTTTKERARTTSLTLPRRKRGKQTKKTRMKAKISTPAWWTWTRNLLQLIQRRRKRMTSTRMRMSLTSSCRESSIPDFALSFLNDYFQRLITCTIREME